MRSLGTDIATAGCLAVVSDIACQIIERLPQKQWNEDYTKRLKEILLDDSTSPWKAEELNSITRKRECECPIYLGLKEWIGSIEYPNQDLICNLGGSLVLLRR